jgi:hypothetical protein
MRRIRCADSTKPLIQGRVEALSLSRSYCCDSRLLFSSSATACACSCAALSATICVRIACCLASLRSRCSCRLNRLEPGTTSLAAPNGPFDVPGNGRLRTPVRTRPARRWAVPNGPFDVPGNGRLRIPVRTRPARRWAVPNGPFDVPGNGRLRAPSSSRRAETFFARPVSAFARAFALMRGSILSPRKRADITVSPTSRGVLLIARPGLTLGLTLGRGLILTRGGGLGGFLAFALPTFA